MQLTKEEVFGNNTLHFLSVLTCTENMKLSYVLGLEIQDGYSNFGLSFVLDLNYQLDWSDVYDAKLA